MKSNKFLCIILCYNEENTILDLIEDLHNKLINEFSDFVFVDDGSSDNTLKLIHKYDYKVINHPKNIGYGSGVKSGLDFALKEGYTFAIIFPGDHQRSAVDIRKLADTIEYSNFDVVVGSKFHLYSNKHGPIHRQIGNHFYSNLAKIFWGSPLKDVLSGFKVYRVESLAHFIHKLPNRYAFDIVFSYACSLYKLELKEIDVDCKYNKHTSKMNSLIIESIKMLSQLIFYVLKFNTLKQRYNSKS